MRALVTGATGFIGLEVARQLAESGSRPRVMVRRPSRAALLHGLDAEPVQADLASEASLRRAVQGVDTVFHLAARATFESYERVAPTIVDGSLRLMRAAAEAGVRHFVFASSLFVYSSQDRPIDATTPAVPALDYGRAKVAAESGLEAIAAEAGMTLASIRLPHVYGPASLMFEQVRNGRVIFPGRPDAPFAHLHVEDAARALVAAGRTRWSGALPVADRDNADWRCFFDTLREFYPRFRLLRVPAAVALGAAMAIGPFTRFRSSPTLATPDTVRGFNLRLPVEPGLLWEQLRLEPLYPGIRDGIPAALDGWLRFRWRHPVLDRS